MKPGYLDYRSGTTYHVLVIGLRAGRLRCVDGGPQDDGLRWWSTLGVATSVPVVWSCLVVTTKHIFFSKKQWACWANAWRVQLHRPSSVSGCEERALHLRPAYRRGSAGTVMGAAPSWGFPPTALARLPSQRNDLSRRVQGTKPSWTDHGLSLLARGLQHTDAARTVVSPKGDPPILTARYALSRRAREAVAEFRGKEDKQMISVRLAAWALIAVSALWRALGHIDNAGLSIVCGAVVALAHLG